MANYNFDDLETFEVSEAVTNIGDLEYDVKETLPLIRHPEKEVAISLTGDSVKYQCLVKNNHDENGDYSGPTFYPVTQVVYQTLNEAVRPVIFHGYVTENGDEGILAQKLDTTVRKNSWNTSMAKIMETAPGIYFSIQSDHNSKKYIASELETITEPPSFPNFRERLFEALNNNIIGSVEHPIVQKILNK